MRQLAPYSLWLGSVVDAWDLAALHRAELQAIVDLASNEAPIKLTRDLTYCRFPIVDGIGNRTSMVGTSAPRLFVATVNQDGEINA